MKAIYSRKKIYYKNKEYNTYSLYHQSLIDFFRAHQFTIRNNKLISKSINDFYLSELESQKNC